MQKYKNFEFQISVKKDHDKYLPYNYSGRAIAMKYKGDFLWKDWSSSKSYFSVAKDAKEASERAEELTKKWIDEYLQKNE